MRDEMDDYLAEDAAGPVEPPPAYEPARVVAPPAGRLRAARVAESGTLGDRNEQKEKGGRVTILPFEDMKRRHESGEAMPHPSAAFRSITEDWLKEFGLSASFRGRDELADPAATILMEGGFIWIALLGEGKLPVGCLALHKHSTASARDEAPPAPLWELGELGVKASSRRRGIGRLLIDMLLRQFCEAAGDVDDLHLEVPASLEAAYMLFQKMGFEDAGEEAEPRPELLAAVANPPNEGRRMVYRRQRRRPV